MNEPEAPASVDRRFVLGVRKPDGRTHEVVVATVNTVVISNSSTNTGFIDFINGVYRYNMI